MALKTSFREVQSFRQIWLSLLLGGINLFLLYGLFQQLVMGNPFGNQPASNFGLLLIVLSTFAISAMIYLMQLRTRINENGVTISFFPLLVKGRHIPWEDIDELEVRKSVPLAEFGGWGLRYGPNGKIAYTAKGRHGLELHLNHGKRIFIGTQKPAEVKEVIENLEKQFTLELLDLKRVKILEAREELSDGNEV